jgi:Immunoglobulin-like domain of bacterial spore germination
LIKRLLLIAVIIPALLAIACSDDDDDTNTGNGPTPVETIDGETSTPAGSDGGTETPVVNVCLPNPAPGTSETIQVDTPAPLSKHEGSVTVSGQIAAFEAAFVIRIYDPSGAVLVGATGMAAEGQVLSPFSQEVRLPVAGETAACLWVYEESARDGSPTNVAQVPIVVAPAGVPTSTPEP